MTRDPSDIVPRVPPHGAQLRDCIRATLAGTESRHDREGWLVPGLTLRQSQAMRQQFPVDPRPAAVLVPIVERGDELTLLLTQRATQLRNHAGQISFPGGCLEPGETPLAGALREAQEEVGLDPRFVSVAGYLTDHVLLTGFRVTPVVGFVREGFELRLARTEVDSTFEVPLQHVFERANYRARLRRFTNPAVEVKTWDIPYGDHNIWGATAGMLLNLVRRCMGQDGDE